MSGAVIWRLPLPDRDGPIEERFAMQPDAE
jgi:hypothetical protein